MLQIDEKVDTISWCREHVQRTKQEYNSMVDGLLMDNEKLEGLARLLACRLDNLADGQLNKDAHSLAPMKAVAESVSDTAPWIEEFLQQGGALRRQREEQISLQCELREERLEGHVLRQHLEATLRELNVFEGKVTAAEPIGAELRHGNSVEENDRALHTQLLQMECACTQEARQCEHTEVRCALVESRCQAEVQRLESEVVQLRSHGGQSLEVDGGRLKGNVAKHLNCTALRDEVVALQEKLRNERELHKKHVALYRRYLPDIASACGCPLPAGTLDSITAAPLVPGVSKAGNTSPTTHVEFGDPTVESGCNGRVKPAMLDPSDSGWFQGVEGSLFENLKQHSIVNLQSPHNMPSSPAVSEDEDYAWQGYLEQATSGACFKKVFVELSRIDLRISVDRGALEPLSTILLSTLGRPAELVAENIRCFEVVLLGISTPQIFRCVSERRAAQWVEAINRAWQRCNQPLNLQTKSNSERSHDVVENSQRDLFLSQMLRQGVQDRLLSAFPTHGAAVAQQSETAAMVDDSSRWRSGDINVET